MRKILGWAAIAAIILWAAAFFILKSTHDRVTEEMLAVAAQLRVPSGWTLEDENVEREKLICLNANPCPSLSRTWQTDTELDPESLRNLAASAGWAVQLEGDCSRPSGAIGRRSVCSGHTIDGGYEVTLRVDSPDEGAPSQFWLHLEASGE